MTWPSHPAREAAETAAAAAAAAAAMAMLDRRRPHACPHRPRSRTLATRRRFPLQRPRRLPPTRIRWSWKKGSEEMMKIQGRKKRMIRIRKGSSRGHFLMGEPTVPSLVVSGVHMLPTALGPQEQLSELVRESPDNSIIQEKMKILSKHYVLFRRTRQDGSCFYRAFIFSYMEILRQMQDKQAEVTRLMECLDMSKDRFSCLEWNKAYFSIDPEEYFSSVVSELNEVLNVIAAGCTSEWLYQRSLQESFSGRIISLLRLITETEIRTDEFYKQSIPKNLNVLQFCWKAVRSLDAEATATQMRALTYALGIPLRVEVVDKSLTDQGVLVKRLDFFHEFDMEKGPLRLTRSYLSSSTARIPLKQGSYDGDLLSSDGTPMLTLLCRHGHCDILYRK
ncbi:hypothetical protein CFC21_015104 [Triticum aestivum]|uniref:Ubiquitinyl hydrolase 1 n=2 Tax=Triticum aestivum TaxID=4565 RepID=A0A3B6AQS2_WHEAT|nr:OVARIAN TUMOR DOMAIN-containing deubiquitinating enzyme 1-like [Triticum aestivum]KAF6999030.1 hypothetical protein CFC21_015104 [Triticum aestivum]